MLLALHIEEVLENDGATVGEAPFVEMGSPGKEQRAVG